MKVSNLLLAVSCSLSAVFAGLSGTYTIKPDGSGDFPDFQSAANALVDSGISGDCIFEAYTGYYNYGVDLYDVPGSDSWSITFRRAAGEQPVIAEEAFNCAGLNRLTLENLTFEYAWPTFVDCRDCRITNCRFTPVGDFIFEHCSSFVITGNAVRNLCETEGMLLAECPDFTIANNFLALSTGTAHGALNGEWAPRLKLYFNTLWCPSEEADMVSCLYLAGDGDVRNNVFCLARGCDTFSTCITALIDSLRTFVFDYNCFYVESAGFVGHVPDTFVDFAGWQALGYDLHGRYGDPLLVDTSDLHLRQGSPCIEAGVPIAGYEFDIDGDPRDPVHPDIGADEYTGEGVEEMPSAECRVPNPGPTVLSGASVQSLESKVIFDAMGRRVLKPGSGVYFVVEYSPFSSQHSGTEYGARNTVHVRKVVVQR